MNWMTHRLLSGLSTWLPEETRETFFEHWSEDTERQPSPFLHALTYVPAAFYMRGPHMVRPEDVVPISRGHRLLLGFFKGYAALMIFLLAFVDASWLVFTGMRLSSPTPFPGSMLLSFHLLGFFLYALCWHGLGQDWPWLRMTRPGSALMLLSASWLIVLMGLGYTPPVWMTVTWVIGNTTLWTWDAYWGVKRPLKKRGILAFK